MKKLYRLGENRLFWIAGAAYLMLMEGIALYYQYGPGMWYPCALCVQVRAWVMGSLIFSVTGMSLVKKFWWRWMSLNLTIVMMAGALYTSYYAYGVEQGTVSQAVQWEPDSRNSCLLTNGCPFCSRRRECADSRHRCRWAFPWSKPC